MSFKTSFNLPPVSHWVKIICSTGPMGSGTKVDTLYWDNMFFDIRKKYDWYFKYRAALLQVQNPKCHVELSWGSAPIIDESKLHKQHIKNQLIRKKGMITEIENKLRIFVNEWNHSKLFPVEEDPFYATCISRLERLKKELHSTTRLLHQTN